MLAVIDIGNTNIVFGFFKNKKFIGEFRLQSDTGRTIDEYTAIVAALIKQRVGEVDSVKQIVISSVVPPLTSGIAEVMKRLFFTTPVIVGPGVKTGIAIRIAEPASVGADRIVNALAVRELYGTPALVVDFGTATTFDYVSAKGDYEGGIIAPGLHISLESLVTRTAKLPRIDLTWPNQIIGKSTVSAMQSGTLVGYVCMVDGLIEKACEEIGEIKHIVATGGLGEIIIKHSRFIKTYDPILTLQGMRLIAELQNRD